MSGTDCSEELVKQLSKQLQLVTLERNELARDVESLCLQSGGGSSMWDGGSFVLSERLCSAEAELRTLKSDMFLLEEQRDEYRDEVVEVRKAKGALDSSFRDQLSKCQRLEQDLRFYQTQSALAMADRDRLNSELEEVRGTSIELQQQARQCADAVALYHAQRAALETELDGCRQRLEQASTELEEKMLEAAVVPDLRQKIFQQEGTIASLSAAKQQLEEQVQGATNSAVLVGAQRDILQKQIDAMQRMLECAEQQAQAATKQAASDAERLQAELATAQEQLDSSKKQEAQLQLQLQGAQEASEQRLAAALHQQRQAVQLAASLQQQLAEQQQTTQQKEHQLQEVTKEKVDALIRLSQAQFDQSKDSSQMEMLQQMVKDMKVKLAQATQEKVEVLMRMAASGSGANSSNGEQAVHGASAVGPARAMPIPGRSPISNAASNGIAAGSLVGTCGVQMDSPSIAGDTLAWSEDAELADTQHQYQPRYQQLSERVNNIERLVVVAGRFKTQLIAAAAAAVAGSQAGSAAVLKVLEDCRAYRQQVGIPEDAAGGVPTNFLSSSLGRIAGLASPSTNSATSSSTASKRVDRAIATEVLDLVDIAGRVLKQAQLQHA